MMMIKKSGVRSQKSEVRRLRDIVFLITVFIFFIFIGGTGDSFGFWPFTSLKKEVYIAKVVDEIITKDEFLNEINKLHKSSRAGNALSEQSSFAMQDVGRFLNELIDNKLMTIEARNLGLDK
ncbi:MAG: SurA N-terminal domain-containing protein, partial [Deltaproteobacteria bacterium]